GQLSKATQQNASASEELAATSEELSGQAEQLQQTVAFFNLGGEVSMVRGSHEVGMERFNRTPRQLASMPLASSPAGSEMLRTRNRNPAEREALLKELANAVEAHAAWRTKFRMAINKQEKIDADAISLDNRCPLGKWLHGIGQHQCGANPEFLELIRRHKGFHGEAGVVARLINARQFSRALEELSGETPFMRASSDVVKAIGALRRTVE
ncbi:MAG: CZB domain-containing protein, partial [Burkholderiales bacterium]|nr:CZB domain-containing protein [Burkholderiales bacterium]